MTNRLLDKRVERLEERTGNSLPTIDRIEIQAVGDGLKYTGEIVAFEVGNGWKGEAGFRSDLVGVDARSPQLRSPDNTAH